MWYTATKDQKHFEAAPTDLEGTFKWDTTNLATVRVTTSEAIGSGKANTQAIIAALGAKSAVATAANDYTTGGKNDWFLPSKDELKYIHTTLSLTGLDGFKTDSADWSSSQYYTSIAWFQRFSDGGQYYYANANYKTAAVSVRVVRAFLHFISLTL